MQRYFDKEVCGRRCHYIKTGSVPREWMMEGSGGGAGAWDRKPRQNGSRCVGMSEVTAGWDGLLCSLFLLQATELQRSLILYMAHS